MTTFLSQLASFLAVFGAELTIVALLVGFGGLAFLLLLLTFDRVSAPQVGDTTTTTRAHTPHVPEREPDHAA